MDIRERAVWELVRDPRKDLPNVERIAARVLDEAYALSQYERVKRILELAITRLPEERQQQAATLLFGLRGPRRRAQLNQRQRVAAAEFGITPDAFRDNREISRRHEQTLIRDLADALLSLAKASRSRQRPVPEELFGEIPYVARPGLEAQFAEALTEEHGVIALVGDIGVGKSKLAYELTFRRSGRPDKDCWIRAYDEALAIKDIGAALFQHGIDSSGVDSASMLKLKFAHLMQRADGPKFVVLDGISNVEMIDVLLLPGFQSTVIATATTAIAADGVKHIAVPDMSDTEASELVKALIEFVPDETVRLVTEVAGNRPRVLVQACHLLRPGSGIAASDVARGLRNKPQIVLMLSEPNWKQRFTRQYQDLLAALEKEHKPALMLLVLMSINYQGSHNSMRMLEPLFGMALKLQDREMQSLSFSQAVDVLVSHSVITKDNESVSINVLVREIVRSLMRGSAFEISKRICQTLEPAVARVEQDSNERMTPESSLWRRVYDHFHEMQIAPPPEPRYGFDFFLLENMKDDGDVFYQVKGVRPQPHRPQVPYLNNWLVAELREFTEGLLP
jgi:hypothetical protein